MRRRRRPYAKANGVGAGYPIIAALGLNPDEKSDKDRVYGLIKAWKGQGHFVVADRYDPRNKKRNQFLEPHKSPTPADDADTSPTPPISDTLDTWSFQRCDTYTHPL